MTSGIIYIRSVILLCTSISEVDVYSIYTVLPLPLCFFLASHRSIIRVRNKVCAKIKMPPPSTEGSPAPGSSIHTIVLS